MFGFLGFILMFILMIVLIGVVFIFNIMRMIFGLGSRAFKRYDSSQQTSVSEGGGTQSTTASYNKRKIFGHDEGEYVEYEEVE